MEKVTLYVQRFLALIFSFAPLVFIDSLAVGLNLFPVILILSGCLLLFSYLNFRITGEKPRFLFGLTQSDAYLTKKGGFWNLFKWIVISLGFVYDLLVWTVWGIFLIFVLFADILMLIKFVLYWIIHAVIWFIRQLFPPIAFLFKMFVHYIINWFWWIYQVTFRNMRISVNRNFYIIALWGTIPAIFIVFLFYAISQIAGIPGLVLVSAIFALVPLVWSYGEIAALRYENREKESYGAVRGAYRNGWETVRAVLFYLILILVLLVAEIVLNLLGWIPNLSMSLLGISLNINMFISLILVFLAVIIVFVEAILPTHILNQPDHQNDLKSSVGFLRVIGQKFLRYLVAQFPATIFTVLLLVIPLFVMFLAYNLTETIKDGVLEIRMEQLSDKASGMEALDAHRIEHKKNRLAMYQEIPESAAREFSGLRKVSANIVDLKEDITTSEEMLISRKGKFDKEIQDISAQINVAKAETADPLSNSRLTMLSNERLLLEEEYLAWEKNQKECIAFLQVDLKEARSMRAQMPVLYLFVGIFLAIFGGLVFAVHVAYIGNVNYELYGMREDGKPTYWRQTLNDISSRDGNQPLLGFTFLVIIGLIVIVFTTII